MPSTTKGPSKPGRAPLDHLQADAATKGAPVEVELVAGRMVEVLPSGRWRSSALTALRQGDFELWAEKCLTPEGFATWLDVDPTLDDVQAFLARHKDVTGTSSGE